MVQRNMGVGGPVSRHNHPFAFCRLHHDSNLKMCICGNWLSRASYLVRLSFLCLSLCYSGEHGAFCFLMAHARPSAM